MEINVSEQKEDLFCDPCTVGKQHRAPFVGNNDPISGITKIIHVDLCGPMQVKSIERTIYLTS